MNLRKYAAPRVSLLIELKAAGWLCCSLTSKSLNPKLYEPLCLLLDLMVPMA